MMQVNFFLFQCENITMPSSSYLYHKMNDYYKLIKSFRIN